MDVMRKNFRDRLHRELLHYPPLPWWERAGVRGNNLLHPHLHPPPSRGRIMR
jgi:hypothetical protein